MREVRAWTAREWRFFSRWRMASSRVTREPEREDEPDRWEARDASDRTRFCSIRVRVCC